ncbi:c-type cytochrome [Granulicella sibirica]|uniref:Cytochrome C553 (Soluble cytochrome f) n=1 Tax=Granulicella sibirica TaxID=2479048 RepID=A0A4Q0SV26_9BACT|nr:c-type cytochrome [Granulicella sibirica]RXH54192.1 Cytochrome C553 (soluble cytochrome f) [Granulicella sibirica]
MRPLACVAFCSLLLCGCKATPPGKIESKIAIATEHHVTIGNKHGKNPIPDNSATRADGKDAFSHYCAACHGYDGQNTGVPFADRMSPPVPLLNSPDAQQFTDGQLKWIIDNGIWPSGMPASRGMLSDEEQWSIVVYLRHLPPAGAAGTPEMYNH